MSSPTDALASAGAQVAPVRDDPAARLALMRGCFHGPTRRAPRHLPFRRAALSFMLELVRDGNPIYAWPFEQRHVWRKPNMALAARVLDRVTRAR
jgi:hypothetical protein